MGLSMLALLTSCSSHSREDYSLDPGIPRIETDTSEIAYIRTRWFNGKNTATAFLDSQDRVLESFKFGRYSLKTVERYEGVKNIMTINYTHSDSSPMGYVDVDTLRRTYDAAGRLVLEARTFGAIDRDTDRVPEVGYYRRYFGYSSAGDTILKKVESSSYDTTNKSSVANVERWERDKKQRPTRHYRLFVMKRPSDPHDTVYHSSQRFAYDSTGKLALAWFDYMYLGQFYRPAGPDTIWYEYDSKNRLVAERHRYTTDMSNKSEPDTAGLANSSDETANFYRNKFFVGNEYFPNNNRTDVVTYQYEVFDPKKHLPLKIPIM